MIRRVLAAALALLAATMLLAPTGAPAAASSGRSPSFAYYYLWWSTRHWHDLLGAHYPYTGTPSPLPAALDAGGCGTRALYPGAHLTDVSQHLGYQQDNPNVVLADVRAAAAAGLTGFAVNWRGTGSATQTPTSNAYNRRLQYLFNAVHTVNTQGVRFTLILNYKGSAARVPLAGVRGDFAYLAAKYGHDPALDHHYSAKPEIIFAGTWKYSTARLAAMASAIRPRMFLIGDEKPATWTAARGRSLDGDTYYWSSQSPSNTTGLRRMVTLAGRVHAAHKLWLAPLTPGYNSQLLPGSSTCVPRGGGATMQRLFQANSTTRPDGWAVISWNEIAEGTYLVPLTRYGSASTTKLRSLVRQ